MDNNLPAKVKVPITWPNQLLQSMYSCPIQQLPPYQGYHFPPMHPHYAGSMQWAPNMKESNPGLAQEVDYHRNHKSSSRKKENFLNSKNFKYSEEDGKAESVT